MIVVYIITTTLISFPGETGVWLVSLELCIFVFHYIQHYLTRLLYLATLSKHRVGKEANILFIFRIFLYYNGLSDMPS